MFPLTDDEITKATIIAAILVAVVISAALMLRDSGHLPWQAELANRLAR